MKTNNLAGFCITLLVPIMLLMNACKSAGSKEEEPLPQTTNSFGAVVDGVNWKSTKANGGTAVVGGLLSIVGSIDDRNEISIQMIGKDLKTGVDYLFEIPAKEENKMANLIYKRNGSVLFAKSGKVRFSTFSNKKIEGTFEAQVTDYINANADLKSGTFTINF